MNFTLSTDTCCDELKGNLKTSNISYIPLVYINGDNIYYDNFSTLEEYQYFYTQQKAGVQFKTAGLNPFDVEEYFTNLLKEHKKDIVHISLSSGLSGTFNIVKNVADELNKKNEKKIYVVDSLSATAGQRLALAVATNCRDEGMTANEAVCRIEDERDRAQVGFFVCDLDYLKRGGRISLLQATFGKILQLRPMIEFKEDGKLHIVDKIIGTKRAVAALAEKAKKLYDKDSKMPFYIAHTGNVDLVLELTNMLKKEFDNPLIVPVFLGPVIGTHTGPNTLGLVYLKKKSM